jgi:hypothetical protein
MWRRYEVTWRFTNLLCGSVPQNRELVRAWIESRAPKEKPPEGPSFDEIEAEVAATTDNVEDVIERITLGFQRDENGLFVRGATIRSHIKDCAYQLREYLAANLGADEEIFENEEAPESEKAPKKKGKKTTKGLKERIRNLKSILANRVYIEPYRVHILRDGKPVQKEDGQYDQAVHVMTALGPRSALKVIRYVERPTLKFELLVLDDGFITDAVLEAIFEYGSVHGYGGERSMGEGRYEWEMKQIWPPRVEEVLAAKA